MKPLLKFSILLSGIILFGFTAAAQSNIGWSLIWSDEFSQADGSSPDPVKWTYDLGAGGWGNSELEYYTSRTNNVRIEGGKLVIEARQENYSGSSYTSARLKTKGKVSWTYGRIEARVQIPRGQGIWPAFWMMGTNIDSVSWPTCGEIDIMENIGREPTQVHGTIHGPGYSGSGGIGGSFTLSGGGIFADDFHIYALEWTTNQLKWFVDGQQYFSVNPASLPGGATWVYTQPQFILFNLAVGGVWPGNPDGTTVFPQRMVIDYVRVYAATNLIACNSNALINPGFESASLANWSSYGAGFNTLSETINNVPVHDGTNVFKVFGQFGGSDNYSGVLQDIPAVAGQSFTASGWAMTSAGDQIAGNNTAWLEVSFRNASASVLSLFRSATITSNTVAGAWMSLPVTNQLNPATFVAIGLATNLVAPANTSFVRYQVVFHQPAMAAGAVLFDDLKLNMGGSVEVPVVSAGSSAGNNFNLTFSTFLDLPYEVRWKSNLIDSTWLLLTNLAGDGSAKTVSTALQSDSWFFRVTRLCN